MKKLFIVLFVMACATAIHAQYIVNGFESAVADTFFHFPPQNTGLASGEGSLTLTDVTTGQYDGNGALKVDYVVHSSESYGGYSQLQYSVPQSSGQYMDWSNAKSIRIWVNVLTPTSPDSSVEFRMQIFDAGGESDYWNTGTDHENWYWNGGSGIFSSAPGWQAIDIPLVDLTTTQGITSGAQADGLILNGWSGTANNGVLDLDKIVGYVIEFETPSIDNNGKGTGTVLFDKLQFLDTPYPPIATFDNIAGDTSFFNIDVMEFAGEGNMGAVTLTDVTDKPFEGASSLQVDFSVNASQSWGGYVNMEHLLPAGEYLPDMSGNSNLYLYLKVPKVTTGNPNRVAWRFFLYDEESDGHQEWWQIEIPHEFLYTASDEWQQIKLPLENMGYSAPAIVFDGFVVPSWTIDQNHGGDGILNLAHISGWKIELSAAAEDPNTSGMRRNIFN